MHWVPFFRGNGNVRKHQRALSQQWDAKNASASNCISDDAKQGDTDKEKDTDTVTDTKI